MSQITPITYALVQGVQANRQLAVAREVQIRHAQTMEKDSATWSDELEHQVESPEETVAAPDQANHNPGKKKKGRKPKKSDDQADPESHLDLTA